MKLCYASYNDKIPLDHRENYVKRIGLVLAQDLTKVTGQKTEVVCCTDKPGIIKALEDGCDVVVTEMRLKMPDDGRPGDDSIGFGTVKEWLERPGVKRVILLFADNVRPRLDVQDGRDILASGVKVVELFRKGYYDGLYITTTDLTGANIAKLAEHGRTEQEAKDYYGVTDKMLAVLIDRERTKKTAKAERKKGVFALFGKRAEQEQETETDGVGLDEVKKEPAPQPQKPEPSIIRVQERKADTAEDSNAAEEPAGHEVATPDLEKANENLPNNKAKEQQQEKQEESAAPSKAPKKEAPAEKPQESETDGNMDSSEEAKKNWDNDLNSDAMRMILSGNIDALFDDEREEPAPEKAVESKGFSFDTFDSGLNVPEKSDQALDQAGPEARASEDGSVSTTTAQPETDGPKNLASVAAQDNTQKDPEEAAKAAPVESLRVATADEACLPGKITSALNGGSLLTINLTGTPPDDVSRYSVTIMCGGGKGRVVNGRYQSGMIVFVGYCVKYMMGRMLLVEVPDEEVPGTDLSGRECMVTFALLPQD